MENRSNEADIMNKYKVYIRYALGGTKIKEVTCKNKHDFYAWVGKLYLNSLVKIEYLGYTEIREQ